VGLINDIGYKINKCERKQAVVLCVPRGIINKAYNKLSTVSSIEKYLE